MDNPLTPKKIQRLIYLAEDKSFNANRVLQIDNNRPNLLSSATPGPETSQYESSSGLLDLDRCEGFGETDLANLSLSKSTFFVPGEMTGRSTGADDIPVNMPAALGTTFSNYGRFSNVDEIAKKMEQQSNDVKELMRQSIASGYSFHSKRDLTADEASLVYREAPLPVNNSQINMHLKEVSVLEPDPVEMSMGSYFQNRCVDFNNVLPRTESPHYDVSGISISEVSEAQQFSLLTKEQSVREPTRAQNFDMTLDCVPVRQPKSVPKMAELKMDASSMPKSPKENAMPPPIVRPIKQASFMLDPTKQHLYSSIRPVTEESSRCDESLSLSKIACFLGKESDVNVSAMLKQMKLGNLNDPLNEISMNIQENRTRTQDNHVTHLKDTKNMDTGSSAGTINTVVDLQQFKVKEIPSVLITRNSLPKSKIQLGIDNVKAENRTRSKSPSSKSRSTMSTVQDNFACSFKSNDSPVQMNNGEAKVPQVPSLYIEYKELDKSVNWQEIMHTTGPLKTEGYVKVPDEWIKVTANSVEGYVGASTPAAIEMTSSSENWLTARIEFKLDQHKELIVDLPRFPILLAPGKIEQCLIHITSNTEINIDLHFTVYIRDSGLEGEIERSGCLKLNLKMPAVQAISADCVNKVTFPPVQEGRMVTKCFILISDCLVDLQLDLTVAEGNSIFAINSVQEINKSDVSRKLFDHISTEENKGKYKAKGVIKQMCKLSSGKAIKVTVTFAAPNLSKLNIAEKVANFNGCLNVNLIGVNTLLNKVDLTATVGTVELSFNIQGDKIHLKKEVTTIAVTNTGTIPGSWVIKFKDAADSNKFKVSTNKMEIDPGVTIHLKISYVGDDNVLTESSLKFEDIYTGHLSSLSLSGGKQKPKTFPIKTSTNLVSWVRTGRKEISLKNITDKRVHLKVRILGEGFYIDLPQGNRQIAPNSNSFITIGPQECRPLPILFNPGNNQLCSAALHLAYEGDTEMSRKLHLQGGSVSGVRWSGLVTYGDTALVRAAPREDVALRLINRHAAPAFYAASVQFNLQYRCVSQYCALVSPRGVVRGGAAGGLRLRVDWPRLERRARLLAPAAHALATVTVISGAETTRRRILRILRNQSNGEIDVSSLPEHLQRLVGPFEGEDPSMDDALKDFVENKSCLDELVGGIQELTAQIDMSEDFSEQNTILITDDTVLEHHTLCDEPE